jgi:hypothetical protein
MHLWLKEAGKWGKQVNREKLVTSVHIDDFPEDFKKKLNVTMNDFQDVFTDDIES